MLFDAKDEGMGNIKSEMNRLLFIHFNRYVVYRSTMPKILTSEIDELMCSSFAMNPDTFQKYKDKIDHDVYAYINKKLDFCSFKLESLASSNRM